MGCPKGVKMSTIKIMALGGVRENGKNLYVAEVNEHIFVLDAGAKYPGTTWCGYCRSEL